MMQLVYTMFITNKQALFHLWWKETWTNIKKSQIIMTMIVDILCVSDKLAIAHLSRTIWPMN